MESGGGEDSGDSALCMTAEQDTSLWSGLAGASLLNWIVMNTLQYIKHESNDFPTAHITTYVIIFI